MITTMRIQNFKCLLDTEIELGPLTVLIGPNDSGKTSFLDAIRLLGKTSEHALADVFKVDAPGGRSAPLDTVVWRREQHRSVGWHVCGQADKSFEYRLELPASGGLCTESLMIDGKKVFQMSEDDTSYLGKPRDGKHTGLQTLRNMQNREAAGVRPRRAEVGKPSVPKEAELEQPVMLQPPRIRGPRSFLPVAQVCDLLRSTEEYRLVPDRMRMACKAEPAPSLSTTGDNLAAVLNSLLTGPDRSAVIELEHRLHEAIPTLRGLSTPAAARGNGSLRQIEFALSGETKPPITIPSSQASDGAMFLTAFLALAYGNTPKILLIEEPENGLHPSRLQMVIDILRKMSRGEIGNQARQIILTTHSPLLLNFVQPAEVRIFQRTPDGATRVTAMDQVPGIERLHKEYAPGELWYLFGEDELVKERAE
jgi:predicted ATPase